MRAPAVLVVRRDSYTPEEVRAAVARRDEDPRRCTVSGSPSDAPAAGAFNSVVPAQQSV